MKRLLVFLLITVIAVVHLPAKSFYSSLLPEVSPREFQYSQIESDLLSESTLKRRGALSALYQMRAFTRVDLILPHLDDDDATVRLEAVQALGWCGNPSVLPYLVDALTDSHWAVRQAAAYSLENITSFNFQFDALAPLSQRKEAESEWRSAVSTESKHHWEHLFSAKLTAVGLDDVDAESAMRAVGMLRLTGLDSEVTSLLKKKMRKIRRLRFRKIDRSDYYYKGAADPNVPDRDLRYAIQTGIRTLGLLGTAQSEDFLVRLLEDPQWAVYAAEALGDIGSESAALALINSYPAYCKSRRRTFHYGRYLDAVRNVPHWDDPGFSSVDRIPRTSFMILDSLTRCDLSSPRVVDALKQISPEIIYEFPNDFDSTIVYEQEPWQMNAAYLLEVSGVRQAAVNEAFKVLGLTPVNPPQCDQNILYKIRSDMGDWLDSDLSSTPPYAGKVLTALCRESNEIPLLMTLLNHQEGWIRMDASKTLLFLGASEAGNRLKQLLHEAPVDASYGYSSEFDRFYDEKRGDGYDEINDPSPRHKEGWLRALGGLGDKDCLPLLERYLNQTENATEIMVAAARALCDLEIPEADLLLLEAERSHPLKAVQLIARERLYFAGIAPLPFNGSPEGSADAVGSPKADSGEKLQSDYKKVPQLPDFNEIVFIRGEHKPGNLFQVSEDQTAYSTTDSGPTYRLGKNIWKVRIGGESMPPTQLTFFEEGYVADLEVSPDGQHILFAARGGGDDPWWHIFEMRNDGSGLRQITGGPFHDVQPNYLPDGRIVFSSSRLGYRDEYHGYPSTGLTVMNRDGSDIRVIGLNLGRDAEPSITPDGRILFTRLELFYSRLKTEWNLLSVFPDGSHQVTHYGPEARSFWTRIKGSDAVVPPRHRLLRITQPHWLGEGRYLINSFRGPMIVGPEPDRQRILRPDNRWAVTSPYPLGDGRLLVAAGKRITAAHYYEAVDHGIHFMDIKTGALKEIYNDPETADFEARPIASKKAAAVIPEDSRIRERSYTGQIYCNSIYNSRHRHVRERGRFIRVIEGMPTVARHQTHVRGGVAWRNHGGAVGRMLGVAPVAADGSFALELPADRLFHFQVLDSNRQVLANELLWQYIRPSETKSCVGCHEEASATPSMGSGRFPAAHRQPPIAFLPEGNDFQYRAKMWFKGWAPDRREERMRTVNSINRSGRD